MNFARHKSAITLIRLVWLCLLFASAVPASEVLRYPKSLPGFEDRDAYALELLQLALHKAGSNLQLQASANYMEKSRALTELANNRSVDVVWSMTSTAREADLLPIRISIDKGLLGWRIALLSADKAQLLQQVTSLQDLQQLRAGQGHDWPDRYILEASQLPVVTSSSYASLFLMLKAGRFDYFPRSLLEIEEELRRLKSTGLVADPYLLLHYPSNTYFFVAPGNRALARTLTIGLQRAIADGSFDRLFYSNFGDVLRRARIGQRRVIELENPLLPATRPLQPNELKLNREHLPDPGNPRRPAPQAGCNQRPADNNVFSTGPATC